MNTCLIIIDLQNDYFPGGNMELVDIDRAAANAQLLLKNFRTANLPIIHVQHLSVRPGSSFFLPQTDGAEINELVTPRKDEIVVTKNYPNSFRETVLLEIVEKMECKKLVVCGAMSHMCIDATARAAFDYGFSINVADDACATKDLTFKGETIRASEVHASFMAALSAPYADVLTTNEIIEILA